MTIVYYHINSSKKFEDKLKTITLAYSQLTDIKKALNNECTLHTLQCLIYDISITSSDWISPGFAFCWECCSVINVIE